MLLKTNMMVFRDLCKERSEQLQLQASVDKQLALLPCVKVVNDYLFSQREKNRKLTEEYVQASFYQIPRIASEQLQETRKDLIIIEKILLSEYPCKKLENQNSKIIIE